VTEKAWKQDSLIGRKIYENDQILFGYVKLASCPEFGEFGYFSEAELDQLGWRIWRVRKQDWCLCPDVEVEEAEDEIRSPQSEGRGACVPQSRSAHLCEEVAGT